MEKILEVKDVTKKFGPVTVFHDVNLELYQGEILSLVGENGAGKSTLMNVLGGVYEGTQYLGVGRSASVVDYSHAVCHVWSDRQLSPSRLRCKMLVCKASYVVNLGAVGYGGKEVVEVAV